MTFRLSLERPVARIGIVLAAVVVCVALGFLVLSQFIVGTLADDTAQVSRPVVAAAAKYFPDSARLQARLAAMGLAEVGEDENALAQARSAALRAVSLSPSSASVRLLLAKSFELSGEVLEAERAMREAVRLVPNDANLRWQLANLLVRVEKLDQAQDEFRRAVALDQSLLPAALDLLWQLSADASLLGKVTNDAPAARLVLAQFLLTQSQFNESAAVFSRIDRKDLMSPLLVKESASFIDQMITADELPNARDLWLALVGEQNKKGSLIWNGSFESDLNTSLNMGQNSGLSQFDWNYGRSEYALLAIDKAVGRTGSRAFRATFAGRDTTTLENAVRQLVTLRRGARYRLECYAKAAGLVTPEGPRVALTLRNTSQPIAVTNPVMPDESGWQRLAVDFIAPAIQPPEARVEAQMVSTTLKDWVAVYVTVQRIPKYSYDDPTRGTVWFDDFALTEIPPSLKQQ